ncbi:hypothetical protein [Streptomyces sp. NPDC059994]|uniref:hypothetical protein n=1 Tax=Streptomyces sp. NPDC059994 TaxID=3347029 RepID=UPI003696E865
MTSDLIAQTGMSEYDFMEFECFVSKVNIEGFLYAADNYSPRFESPELQAATEDLSDLRAFYRKHLPTVEAWYEEVGGEKACDLHNDHVDESRKRIEDARLWGVLCTDGYVITCDNEEARERWIAELQESAGKGWRVPAMRVYRTVPGGKWTETPLDAA